jgi:TonB family protein
MNRQRLLLSITLAVLLHAAVFLALELFLKLQHERLPEYSGPMFVQLEELPVVQQAREARALPAQPRAAGAQPQEAPAAATAGVQVQPAPAQGAARLPPGAAASRAAGAAGETPLKPKGPQFRLEGGSAQEAEAQPAPSGQGFQVPSEEPTLPPAGLKSAGAPLRAEAVSPAGQAGEAPALPLESVDRALAQAGGAKAGGGGPARPGAATGPAAGSPARPGAGTGQTAQEGVSILWENPALGREPTFMPRPVIPKWVSEAGLRLTVEFDFVLTPQGVLSGVRLRKSSGYSDVDSSVWEALMRWKFKPVASRAEVKGRVGYLILPR